MLRASQASCVVALSLFERALNLSWHSVRETVRKGTTGPGETSSKKQKHSVFLVSILLPPLSLWLGGFIGATTAAAVARAPAMHVALISFGIAALLFLVTEELLLEAHEAQEHSAHEEHIWWVDMFFFLGFLLSFLMDKLLDTD